MKRIVTTFFILLLVFSLNAVSVSFGADLRSFDSFFRDGIRVDTETAVTIENIRIIIPLRYGKSRKNDFSVIETGVLVSVHPWEGIGLFAEASLVKTGWMWGLYAPGEKMFFSSEGSLGWEENFSWFYFRVKYTVRSSLAGEDVKEERLKTIPQFGESRISVHIGVTFGGQK